MKTIILQYLAVSAAILLALPAGASATCAGKDLIAAMPERDRAALASRAEAVPYPRGNFWRATRDGSTIDLIGTMHLADPRHAALLETARPLIAAAEKVMLEVTADETVRMQDAFSRDPGLGFIVEGPSLIEQLAPDEWQTLRQAMAARGVPAMLASRMRPFMVVATLSMPDCLLSDPAAAANGLDRMIEDEARRLGRPVAGLEGYEAMIRLFDRTDPELALDMLRATLAQQNMTEDYYATLANAYFAGDHRLIWEFSQDTATAAADIGFDPERLRAGMDAIHDLALVERNHAWMDRLLPLAEGRRLVVAVGAGHLAGDDGVLKLLERAGFTLTRLD